MRYFLLLYLKLWLCILTTLINFALKSPKTTTKKELFALQTQDLAQDFL